MNRETAPYGTWKSPVDSDTVASATIRLGQILLDGDDTYWSEMRPEEDGRYVVVRRKKTGQIEDVNPPPFNARTRVHEYGGGAYTVDEGTLYFANFDDQRLYRQSPGEEPIALTPPASMRYADLVVDRSRNRLVCVREDHTGVGEATNTLVAIDLAQEKSDQVLVSGNDFYASPRLSPDGRRLAWLTWNHPNMPWDMTELWVADIELDGSLGRRELIAGRVGESVFQPEWSPAGDLYFVSDASGWWNIYRRRNDKTEALHKLDAEFGLPQWVFGLSTYAFVGEGLLACIYLRQGSWHLAFLDLDSGRFETQPLEFDDLEGIRATPDRIVLLAASPSEHPSVLEMTLKDERVEVLRRASEITIEDGYLSRPQAIEFPTEDGLTAHAFFYPPANRDYRAPADERPPLVVMSHGGPTSSASTAFSAAKQYWTSRGIAILDVNYGGSSGYGRAYRQRLNGQWGVVDVNDCINGARYLIERDLVDVERIAIRGGSAGGYTTLCALTFHDLFKVGASYFGLSDLEIFVRDTHKFESRYLDSLIGPYPERSDLYRERSPIHFVDHLSSAMILFQGLEDKIVPPNQAELMLDAVRKKGLPVAYVPFEGEQHGFRRAENIKRAQEAELYFYGQVFGFEIADKIEPVAIENL